MIQEISYRITFSFPSDNENREQLLSAIDQFLRALEEGDRLMAGSLGLVVEYRRSLKEMGEEQFLYEVSLTLHWPPQIVLGSWPEPSLLRDWMSRGRRDLYDSISVEGRDAADIVRDWHQRAKDLTLSDSLVYAPPGVERLKPVLEDLSRAARALGGVETVTLQV